VADAGPSQSFAAATTVTLDGSKSYDPNGDPITYLWQQEGGPAVALSSPTSAVTTFAAANGQTYAFRLTVKDPSGAFSVARTTVTVGNPSPIIVAFVANPPIINQGQASTLAWQVNNADTVSINNGIGTVVLNGSVMVSPMTSTTYTLTATKGGNVVTQTVTVQVNPAVVVTPLQPKISSFTVSQQFAIAGTTLQLTCSATNATSISLNGVVINAPSATISIQPFVNTPYICIATGAGGLTDQQQLTVNVIPGGLQH